MIWKHWCLRAIPAGNEPKAFEFDGKSSFPACMEAFSEILEFGPTDCDRVQLW